MIEDRQSWTYGSEGDGIERGGRGKCGSKDMI